MYFALLLYSTQSAFISIALQACLDSLGGEFEPHKRFGLILLLSFGILAGFVMIVRIPFIRILEVSTDFLAETVDVAICSIIEPCLGIVAGCLPTVWCLRGKIKRWRCGQRLVQNRSTRDSALISTNYPPQ
ncbi:hypothetical protein TrVGV298_007053 [Trichoderma virens]|nr:hypothetical protein TrVGV298_007053 [Trichoderma virens]